MKIKQVEIDSLFGRDGIITLKFHDDINRLPS